MICHSYSLPIMVCYDSHTYERKMNIDMIVYNLSYSLPITLYWFVTTVIHRRENEKQNEYRYDYV